MRAVIFANGLIPNPNLALAALQPGDVIIAADGGAHHCQQLGVTPAAVIGDFDSLSPSELSAFQAAALIRYPARKDFTDLELALHYALEQGATEMLVLGALGARWDQTLANLLMPAHASFSAVRIRMLDGAQEITLIRPGETLEIAGRPGDTVSLIPLGGDAAGITTHGLEYPLADESLFFGATRGVSNVLLATHAAISLREGLLMCVLIHQM